MLSRRGATNANAYWLCSSCTTRVNVDASSLVFSTSTQAQGAVVLADGQEMAAMMLWTEGKVPPVRQQTPDTRDKK